MMLNCFYSDRRVQHVVCLDCGCVPVYPLGGLFANKLAVIGYELQVIQQ